MILGFSIIISLVLNSVVKFSRYVGCNGASVCVKMKVRNYTQFLLMVSTSLSSK